MLTFFQLLGEGKSQSIDFKFDKTLSEHDRIEGQIRAFIPVLNHARIVKLYLPKELRKEFYESARQYAVVHTTPGLKCYITKLDKIENRIQEIFEQELSVNFWIFPALRGVKTIFVKIKN